MKRAHAGEGETGVRVKWAAGGRRRDEGGLLRRARERVFSEALRRRGTREGALSPPHEMSVTGWETRRGVEVVEDALLAVWARGACGVSGRAINERSGG